MIEAPSRILVGRYEPLRVLGQGGFGTVYEARDRRSGELVALKELISINPRTLSRFKQEFRAMQEVHHPNLVRLDALFEDEGKWMIAMELVEGIDLLAYVYADRDGVCFDDERVRESFSQLAEGLDALHGSGVVHRDLKPANVRVTPAGRAVLLDFGLAITADPRAQSTRAAGHGTVAYMAPEQAASQKVGPGADWYAFGVCLYEALTGVLPIDAETPFALLAAKQHIVPPRASVQANGVSPDLDELCSALLQLDPSARPRSQAVRSALLRGGARPTLTLPVPAWPGSARAAEFSGRGAELDHLRAAYADAKTGATLVVLVEGESGIGKSALVEHFLAEQQDAIVLRSRCYENELLAYKAFDGAIDGIVHLLAKLTPEECALLLPRHAGLLCRLFPSLAAIPALTSNQQPVVAADPSAQRREAFAIFARLLSALSERSTLVLAIDDLQWADAESFRLLQAWLDGRPARCLITATVRPLREIEGDAAVGIAELRTRRCVSTLPLSGLPQQNATALARELMGELIPQAWIDTIVRESGGHPLFITVLARYAESHDPSSVVELTLDAAIAARLGSLTRDARLLLAAVALVGAPLPVVTCGRALGLDEAELGKVITELCRKKLLRRRRAGDVDCFHDRIRLVAVARLPRKQASELHGKVALALAAQENADPAEIARHHEAAGEFAPAHAAYRQAAERAVKALAFARAALLYARAIETASTLALPDAERAALLTARAHALAHAGRSADAARQFLQAASLADGEARTRLRIWATQHLLQSARVKEGMEAARSLLDELGVPMATGTATTLARLAWDRVCLRVVGLEVCANRKSISIEQRMQLDALWGLAMPLAWIDPLASAGLSARHARLARAAGEPTHLARALGEVAFQQLFRDPNDSAADQLLERARVLAATTREPLLEVGVTFREAVCALTRWQFPNARERLEHAHQVAIESCPDQPWLLTIIRISLGLSWTSTGEHARLAVAAAGWLDEAKERDDQFALALIESFGGGWVRHLMRDEPERARLDLAAAMAPWPREPFSFAHYGEVFSIVSIELYRGGPSAAEWFAHELPRLTKSVMWSTPLGKASLLALRGRANLAAYASADTARKATLLTETLKHLHHLQQSVFTQSRCEGLAIAAQLAALQGDVPLAMARARDARAQTEACGQIFCARSMEYLEGWLEADDEGRAKQYAALAFFAAQGWEYPGRAIAVYCPAVDALMLRS